MGRWSLGEPIPALYSEPGLRSVVTPSRCVAFTSVATVTHASSHSQTVYAQCACLSLAAIPRIAHPELAYTKRPKGNQHKEKTAVWGQMHCQCLYMCVQLQASTQETQINAHPLWSHLWVPLDDLIFCPPPTICVIAFMAFQPRYVIAARLNYMTVTCKGKEKHPITRPHLSECCHGPSFLSLSIFQMEIIGQQQTILSSLIKLKGGRKSLAV